MVVDGVIADWLVGWMQMTNGNGVTSGLEYIYFTWSEVVLRLTRDEEGAHIYDRGW